MKKINFVAFLGISILLVLVLSTVVAPTYAVKPVKQTNKTPFEEYP